MTATQVIIIIKSINNEQRRVPEAANFPGSVLEPSFELGPTAAPVRRKPPSLLPPEHYPVPEKKIKTKNERTKRNEQAKNG